MQVCVQRSLKTVWPHSLWRKDGIGPDNVFQNHRVSPAGPAGIRSVIERVLPRASSLRVRRLARGAGRLAISYVD